MKDFFINLFKNPNFPLYCGIAIAVLASLLILIYVIGKKDKKKFDETQALKLQELQNKNPDDGMTIAKLDNPIPDDSTSSIIPITGGDVSSAVMDAPIELSPSIPMNPEVVPDIKPNDIPPTPVSELPQVVNNTLDEEVYKAKDDVNEIKEVESKFQMEADITPVIPENTIEQMRALNNELDKEITSLENAAAPKVAPVEVLTDTLDVTPPASSTTPEILDSLDTTPPIPQNTQVFSAVNAPAQTQAAAPQIVNNDEIDSL